MEKWGQDKRRDVVLVDIDQLVPADHMLRKIEKIMDYDWLYERLSLYYCHDNGRPGTDPVVLIKMVLLQHLYGIPSLRQTQERVNDTVSYRWFLGYSLLDKIPHFATVSYAFCQRFPAELPAEIFAHILNTRSKTTKGHFQPWDYKYDEITDTLTCPAGKTLRHTTTDKDGRRIYRSTPSECRGCPKRKKCGARDNGEKMIQRHIWAEHLNLAEELRKTSYGKFLYTLRKESIERVFADAKEKHGMRYTNHRGLARVTQ